MRRLSVVVPAVLAALLALGGVAVPPASAAAAEHRVADNAPAATEDNGSDVLLTRYGGADRYETSLRIAEAVAAEAGGSLEWVVLVSGERWTDAVVAAPLAGARNAPVLMTPPHELRDDALDFLKRTGVSLAVVIGPDASGGVHGPGRGVAESVLADLAAAGISPQRATGVDRYHTSRVVAAMYGPRTMAGLGSTAIVASGEVFADALVAGPFAARGHHPVLLTPPDELYPEVARYLQSVRIEHVVLMGGTAALSDAVEQSIKDLGINVTRVAGDTRYDTAVKTAELVDGRYSDTAGAPCFDTSTIGVARARVPFDSFSAAPLLGRLCAPLVLADPEQIPPDTAAYLDAAREAHGTVDLRVFGGDAAVSGAAIDAYLAGEVAAESIEDEGEEPDDKAVEDGAGQAAGLPAGTCGGLASDPVRRLSDHPKSEDPAWSPDCSRLVYSREGRLYEVNVDGSDARKMVSVDGAFLDEPAWSPDGTRVAFTRGSRNVAGHWERHIWVVDADGSGAMQLTTGDVQDENSDWSPDGTAVVFDRLAGSGRDDDGNRIDADRSITVMDADGSDFVSLTDDVPWDHGPLWSPDGAQIAYITGNGTVRVVVPNDKSTIALAGGALWYGGLAWSPDGTMLAFSRSNDESGADIVTVHLDGIEERQVTDLDGWATDPSWSPDGQLIAFSHYDQIGDRRDVNGTRYASVVGAHSGMLLEHAAVCRPIGRSNSTTAGFPLPEWAAPARGTVRVAVLFMDFPDAQAAHTAEEEAALGLPWAEEYLERNSYRKLDVEFVPHHTWLRAPGSYQDYLEESVSGSMRVRADSLYADAVALVDDEIDFSGFHSLAVVLPSTHFFGGTAGGYVEADGVSMRRHINNNRPRDEPGEPVDWGRVAAHELAHNLGLLDMYPYDDSLHERPDPSRGQEWVPVKLGLMELDAYFLADASLMLLRVTRTYPDGAWWWFGVDRLQPVEMLAWSRWQLGWLNSRQAACITGDDATVTLAPVARTGGDVAMAAVPLSSHEVIVIESRRRIGYDRGPQFTWPRGGTGRRPALIEEGVLVYTVDTLVGTGRLPLRIAGDGGNGQVPDFPVLQRGDSVTVLGYTVTVTADDGDTHTVSITRND